MAKQIMFDDAGRRKMRQGIEKLADTVRVTLGPTGRNVMIGLGGKAKITKDGDSIAREIEVEDPFENMGAKLVNEVSSRTNKEAGDGTTTSVVLAEALVQEGSRFVAAGANPIALRNGMHKAANAVSKYLTDELARPVSGKKEIEHVATIASNGDTQIGKVLAEAMTKVGSNGVVTVEKGEGVDVVLDYVPGIEFDKGYISPYFVTDKAEMTATLEKPLLLITDQKISNIRDLVPVLEKVVASKRPLLVIADDVDGEALAGLLINRLRGVINCVAIKAPAFGDRRKAMLEDLAVQTGGAFLAKDLGLDWDKVDLSHLGSCQRVEVEKGRTIFFKGKGAADAIEARMQQIRAQIEQTTSDYDKEKLQERLGRLEGKIAVVRVGGFTEAEIDEKEARVEDALNATRAAMEEGIVPGAGTAFVRAAEAIGTAKARGDEKYGVEVVTRALRRPLNQLAENVGIDGPAVVAEVEELETDWGFDASKNRMCDLVGAGIVDAAKVLRIGLQNAVSIASLHLVSDALITDISEESDAAVGAVQ